MEISVVVSCGGNRRDWKRQASQHVAVGIRHPHLGPLVMDRSAVSCEITTALFTPLLHCRSFTPSSSQKDQRALLFA